MEIRQSSDMGYVKDADMQLHKFESTQFGSIQVGSRKSWYLYIRKLIHTQQREFSRSVRYDAERKILCSPKQLPGGI